MNKTTFFTGMVTLLLATIMTASDNGRGRHKQFYVVPAPGAVAIDGKLDDWDLSGQIEMFTIKDTRNEQNAKVAAMYDDKALYISGKIADKTPMMNRHDPKVNLGKAWDADALQFRLTLDPKTGYPVREATFDYKGKNAKKDTRDDIIHMLLWHYTDNGAAYLTMQKGMTYRPVRPDWLPGGLVPADKFDAFYRKWDDGKGYTFEYRIPWSTFGVEGPPTPGATVAGTTQVMWSRPDGLAHIRAQGVSYDIMGEPGFPFQNVACWGRVIFAEKGNVSRDLVEAGVPPEKEKPLSFTYELPQAGEVTLQLERPDGTVVRILEAQEPRKAGKTTVVWDGLDANGKVLPAGEYKWRGIVSPTPVKAEYRFSVHNSGRPPYTTDDGKGGWGGDHGTPQDVISVGDKLFMSWDGAEYGSGIIRVDLDGNKQWGIPSCAKHLASDGKRFYATGDHHTGATITIFELAEGRPALLGKKVRALEPPAGGTEEKNHVSGLLWHKDILYASYRDRNLVALFSTTTGQFKGMFDVPAPGRLAVTPSGTLLVVSENKVLSFDVSGLSSEGKVQQNQKLNPKHRTLISDHLDDPQGIAVGPKGTIYVANRGKLQNVSVFDANGKYLRSIGKEGGRPAVGAYDPQGMLEAGGIAIDPKGRLWVAETLDGPKRISVWDTKTGANLDEYFGAAGYFSYGYIDPDKPNEILAHNVLWDIDWKNNTTRPKSTIWRQQKTNMMPSPGPYAYVHIPKMITANNGIQYLWGHRKGSSILMRREGDIFKPFAALLQVKGKTRIPLIDNDKKSWPPERRKTPLLLWQDANNDQIVQKGELTLLPSKKYGRSKFACVEKDLTVRLSKGQIWKPIKINDSGQPIFDPAKAEKAALSGREGYMDLMPDDSVISLKGGRKGMTLSRQTKEGEMLWNYPGLILWKNSLNLPILKAGRLWGMTGLMGIAGDFFAHQTYFGINQIFRADGQYIGAILNDRRKVGRGPYAGQSEGQGGSFVKLQQDGKDRYFVIGGSNDVRVWEVLGLDSIQDLPGGSYTHQADQVAKAQVALDAYETAISGKRKVRIVSGGKSALQKAPASSRKLEDGRGFDVRLSRDDQNLYLQFEVQSPNPLVNAMADPNIVFRGGNLLDMQLATDPKADPARKKPAPGDLRLLVSRRDKKPFAVLFEPKLKGFKGKPIVLKSPTGQESFDRIRVVDNVGLEYKKTQKGFVATVTVPNSLTGLKLKSGDKLKLDLGYIFGNPGGTRTETRATLFNNSFTANVVDDIPHESRLEPANWGEAELIGKQ